MQVETVRDKYCKVEPASTCKLRKVPSCEIEGERKGPRSRRTENAQGKS